MIFSSDHKRKSPVRKGSCSAPTRKERTTRSPPSSPPFSSSSDQDSDYSIPDRQLPFDGDGPAFGPGQRSPERQRRESDDESVHRSPQPCTSRDSPPPQPIPPNIAPLLQPYLRFRLPSDPSDPSSSDSDDDADRQNNDWVFNADEEELVNLLDGRDAATVPRLDR